MQFYGALIFCVTLSAACGLMCYQCSGKSCTDKGTCSSGLGLNLDRCATTVLNDVVTKSCMNSALCVDPIKCCDRDLCNGATTAGSSVLLLLISSAIITVFL